MQKTPYLVFHLIFQEESEIQIFMWSLPISKCWQPFQIFQKLFAAQAKHSWRLDLAHGFRFGAPDRELQNSGFQPWLHTGITWAAFKIMCLDFMPKQLSQNLLSWGPDTGIFKK